MGQFATADDRNCGATSDGTKLEPLIRNGKVVAYGQNSSGQPLMWEVTPGAQTITIKQYEQVQNQTQSLVKTNTVSIDAATGQITSVDTSSLPGSIAIPGTGSIPTTLPTTGTAVDTPTTTTTDTPINISVCGLPNTPACALDDTGFGNLPKSWENNDQRPTMDEPKNQIESILDPEISWNWLPSLLPGSPVQCHGIEFRGQITSGPAAGLDSTASLDLCPYFEYVRMFLGWLFGIGATIYTWRRFIGARTAQEV